MAVNASKKRDARFWKKWHQAGALGSAYSQKLFYAKGHIPAGYFCSECGATNCKLWRRAYTFQPKFLCAVCAAKNQKEDITTIDRKGTIPYKDGYRTDNIGWYVPAIPTEDRRGYWTNASVPKLASLWWNRLPTLPPPKPEGEKKKVNVVFEYTNGSYCGARIWSSYPADELEEVRAKNNDPNSGIKIVAEDVSSDKAERLCRKALLQSGVFTRRLEHLDADPNVSPDLMGAEVTNMLLAAFM
ncbi:MAG: hypothetical protein NTX82_03540 [Candidatus Parcubacteria bacterium]|nr:hypothetical protein [Candidatus Parcubacteria bacterium]